MAPEENKALIRRVIEEIWNQGNMAVVDELYATDCVRHTQPEDTYGLEGLRQSLTMQRTAFPDFHFTIEDIMAEGDKVAFRWTYRGTHKGEYMGIAPTGKQLTMPGISIIRIAGGKIVEVWAEMDMLGLLQQIGAVPPPGQG